MKKIIEVFRCSKKEGAYLYVERGCDLSQLPEALFKQTGKLNSAMVIVLTPEKKLARANARRVLESLTEQGFYLQLPPALEDYMKQIPNDKLNTQPFK